ncbi:MAG: hypothetical protein MUE96_03440 [Bacteroidia bacterium]|jgi:hypothetical protein|nr:hypothetical protein [Bacteroidia bacterium]
MAQRALLFTKPNTSDSILLQVGQKATLLYKGYQGQIEVFNQLVTDINDSTITLGFDHGLSHKNQRQLGKKLRAAHKTIRIADIIGFRRITIGRQLAKSAVNIGLLVGSVLLLQSVYNTPNLNATADFFISMGIGFSVFGIQHIVLPENIKHYMADGWQVTVVRD